MSLDLDDQWSYMKVHGDEGWDLYPSYLNIVVPFVLDLLDELDIKITFFIVGQDAAIEKNKKMEAIELFRKANKNTESARLLATIA